MPATALPLPPSFPIVRTAKKHRCKKAQVEKSTDCKKAQVVKNTGLQKAQVAKKHRWKLSADMIGD